MFDNLTHDSFRSFWNQVMSPLKLFMVDFKKSCVTTRHVVSISARISYVVRHIKFLIFFILDKWFLSNNLHSKPLRGCIYKLQSFWWSSDYPKGSYFWHVCFTTFKYVEWIFVVSAGRSKAQISSVTTRKNGTKHLQRCILLLLAYKSCQICWSRL